MEEVFDMKVQEKLQKLKDIEADVRTLVEIVVCREYCDFVGYGAHRGNLPCTTIAASLCVLPAANTCIVGHIHEGTLYMVEVHQKCMRCTHYVCRLCVLHMLVLDQLTYSAVTRTLCRKTTRSYKTFTYKPVLCGVWRIMVHVNSTVILQGSLSCPDLDLGCNLKWPPKGETF